MDSETAEDDVATERLAGKSLRIVLGAVALAWLWSMHSDVSRLQQGARDNAALIANLKAQVDELSSDLDECEAQASRAEDAAEELDSKVDELESKTSDLDSRVSDLE